jgi:predicted NBD/HSP70 family sugar kinase
VVGGDFVLGLDFGGTKMALATASADGDVVEGIRLDTLSSSGAAQALERAFGAARTLIARTGRTLGGECRAVGAVSPGIVHDDRVLLAPNVPGWEDLALPRQVRQGLGIPEVRVENDVKAAAMAESRRGVLKGADPGLLLNLGTGLSAAVVVDGRVVAGANGAAGEIGYSLRGPDEPAAAHGRAPLEELAGGRAIGERASRLLGGLLTAADVFSHSDPRARALIDETLGELAVHVANLAIFLDPTRIAVGGGLMGSPDLVMAALGSRLSLAAPFPPELVPARFVHDGPLQGAIALALEAAGVPLEATR